MLTLQDRLDHIEAALDDLKERAPEIPIIVEGKRDVRALGELGVAGTILMTNTGERLIDFCDRLAADCTDAVLLTDWDRTGGTIARTLRDNCRGRVKLDRRVRKALAIYSEVSAVEELPGYLASVRRRLRTHRPGEGPRPRHDPDLVGGQLPLGHPTDDAEE